jgi:N-acetylmuramoyl-L-alanine amidase
MKSILILAMLAWTALSQARQIDKIVIHTTDSYATVNQMRSFHRSMGWDDIGYHFIVDVDGAVYEGRDIDRVGAHVFGSNKGSVGVAWIGSAAPTDEQYDALVILTYALMHNYGVTIDNVLGHNDFESGQRQGKTCPNIDMQKFRVDIFRKHLSIIGLGV